MSDRLRDRFPLESTSTVYMSGKSVYNFVRFGRPGHIAPVELFPADAEAIRKEFRKALAEAWEMGARVTYSFPETAEEHNPFKVEA